ncbi:MAG: threonine-phosphate decarboxylase CobD [Pseudomonadota bacterium]
MTQAHGGDLDAAMARFGGAPEAWLDLSTGINPVPYPMPALPPEAVSRLPTTQDITALERTAAETYKTRAPVLALAGAQAAIQLMPSLRTPGHARILAPTYSEHRIALEQAGWQVAEVPDPADLRGADLAVIVSPNNPDGRQFAPQDLLQIAQSVSLLIVDESFVDTQPEHSICRHLTPETPNILALRSFGKFYGLAGLRLGFAIGGTEAIAKLRRSAGPWQVSGPAIHAGRIALADRSWAETTRTRLVEDTTKLDSLATSQGWKLIGGTPLFRTYHTPNAADAQQSLAQSHVWSRIFPYSDHWLRLGLPGTQADWAQLTAALQAL